MKLKTRIILGFTMIILMPLLLFAATLYGFSQSQAQKTQVQTEGDGTVYDISITDSADSQGRVHVMAKDLFISAFVILISVALVVGLWVYRSPGRVPFSQGLPYFLPVERRWRTCLHWLLRW